LPQIKTQSKHEDIANKISLTGQDKKARMHWHLPLDIC